MCWTARRERAGDQLHFGADELEIGLHRPVGVGDVRMAAAGPAELLAERVRGNTGTAVAVGRAADPVAVGVARDAGMELHGCWVARVAKNAGGEVVGSAVLHLSPIGRWSALIHDKCGAGPYM